MNCVFDPTKFSSDWTAVLRGGQSPIYWARDLSRHAERLAMMRRACVWVEELMEVNPRICHQSLMGDCLATLTEEETSPPSIPSAEPHREQRQFTEPESTSKRNSQNAATRTTRSSRPERVYPTARPFQPRITNMRRNAEKSQSNYQPEMVYDLQRQADGSLLRRIARFPDDVSGGGVTSRKSIPTPQRSPHHNPIPPFLNERMKRRDWRNLMAQRTAESLLRTWTNKTQTNSTKTRAMSPNEQKQNGQKQFVSPSLTGDDIEQIVSLSMSEQWLMPLGGRQAPFNTLAQLANLHQLHDVATNREMKQTREQTQITPRSSPYHSGFSGWPNAIVNRNQDFPDSANSVSASRHLEITQHPERPASFMPEDDFRHGVTSEQTVDTLSFPATDSWRSAHSREHVGSSPINIAPPTLTPSLPPLRPPEMSGITPLAVAAATAYQGARQDEAIAQGKDLDLLAAQIKRIIDDEARRHGIDI